jgi:hypothetical protein
MVIKKQCGGSGIRTHGPRKGSTVFKTAAFDHSAIPPHCFLNSITLFFCGTDNNRWSVNCTPHERLHYGTILLMESAPRSIAWEAPEHHHVEKGNDWFFALAIIIVALVIVAILFDNVLLSLLIGLSGGALAVSAAKRPSIIPFAVTVRGVKIEDHAYPFSALESYRIDEEDPRGPQLLIKVKHKLMPLIVIPIPADHIDEIDSILKEKLVEEDLEEPLFVKILELFGF